jgi:hypothetical protein
VKARGFSVRNAIMDKRYGNGPIHDGCMDRGVPDHPAAEDPSRQGRSQGAVLRVRRMDVRGDGLQASVHEMALPTRECTPKSTWVKADRPHSLILRHTARSAKRYKNRGAIEREFGR